MQLRIDCRTEKKQQRESLMYLLLFVIARKDTRILFTYSLVYTYLLFGFVIVIVV